MRIFKNAWFCKFARRERLLDVALIEAVARANAGLVDAELGGGVIKQRVARPGQKRSGGYRSMKTKPIRRYRSDAFAAIHESAEALLHVGAINKVTMREFDEACLETVQEIKPAQIRALRQRERVSQPVFAHYLNVSKNLVSDWERGKRKPGGPALRLLSIIKKHGLETIG